MNKHEKNQQKLLLYTFILALAAFIVACAMVFVAFGQKDQLDQFYHSQSQTILDQAYQTHRITFCYDNNIHPCDSDNIMAWNDAHPKNKLPVAAPTLPNL